MTPVRVSMSHEPANNRIAILRDRATMLKASRAFFDLRGVLEVDCPILCTAAAAESHIDLFKTEQDDQRLYLHASPEAGMKRLIAEGIGDCYQLSHVFRKGELSAKHRPEFTMVEWYRMGFSFEEMIEETFAYCELFISEQSHEVLSYQTAVQHFVGLDPFQASNEELYNEIEKRVDHPHVNPDGDRDDLLNLLLHLAVEPHLGNQGLTALIHYPPTQAAFSNTAEVDGVKVAKRFEVYFQGIELSNGYDELTDPQEQMRRLEKANQTRAEEGKTPLDLDQHFVDALSNDFPPCCGVAVGFDRLMMLRHHTDSIDHVLPF